VLNFPRTLLAPPKKSTQKKGGPGGLPATRVPCASRHFGRSPNSQDLPRLRLANPAQTGRLAQSRNGCDARCASGYPTPRVIFVGALSRARSSLVIPAKAGIQRCFARTTGSGTPPRTPFGAAEHRRENRIKLAPCPSVIERSEIASCASAGLPEKRRRSGHKSQIYARTSHRVPFSLGTFSWASKRKYLARGGETRRKS